MAPRPSWRGYIRLSLVSCPVRLYAAVNPRQRVRFHLLNPNTTNRIRMRPTDAETGAEVPRNTVAYGYAIDKGRHVVVTRNELDRLKIESSEILDIEQFLPMSAIDPIFLNMPYYVAPEGKVALETYRVIRQAMRNTKMAGIGRLVLAMREHPILISSYGPGMLAMTLRPALEVRDSSEVFRDVDGTPPDEELVRLAERIIRQNAVQELDLQRFAKDRYQAALKELIKLKASGRRGPPPKAAPRAENVVNLMDALRRSLEDATAGVATARKRGRRAS